MILDGFDTGLIGRSTLSDSSFGVDSTRIGRLERREGALSVTPGCKKVLN